MGGKHDSTCLSTQCKFWLDALSPLKMSVLKIQVFILTFNSDYLVQAQKLGFKLANLHAGVLKVKVHLKDVDKFEMRLVLIH